MTKALTVRHPWAWAIIHGGKLIENRTARTHWRGPIAIHAATSWSTRGQHDQRVRQALADWVDQRSPRYLGVPIEQRRDVDSLLGLRTWWTMGAIIGTAQLVGCHPDVGCCRPWGESSYVEAGGRTRTAIWHWVLADPVPLDQPVPCLGKLGLWNVEPWIAAEVP